MVVFTCNHCGESLQKPRVEKHYSFQCRNFKSLTCVDCFKDFKGEEYVVHNKCITEEERYSAKGSIPGGIVKKGDVKQESWMEMIKSIVVNEQHLSPSVKNLLNTIATYSNVPRKKPKFINFLKNSMGGRINLNDVETIWTIIESYKRNQHENGNNAEEKTEKGVKTTKKRKADENNEGAKKIKLEESNTETEIFSFKKTILSILQKKSPISLKKLQKKVLNIYVKEMGPDSFTTETIKKFNKKLAKTPNVQNQDGIISLIN